MKGVNKATIVGTLGADPEIRYTADGGAVTNVSIATNEKWKDKKTGEAQERTEWHKCTFFGRQAEIAGEYLKKGSQVYIEGKLRTEQYTDKEGVERYSTKIIVDVLQLLGSKPEGRSAGRSEPTEKGGKPPQQEGSAQQKGSLPPPNDFGAFDEDDIPF